MFKLNFQARDSGIWWGTLGKLQLMLRKASQALYVNEQFNLEEMHNYRRGQITSRLLSALIETKQNKTKYFRLRLKDDQAERESLKRHETNMRQT